MIKRSVVFNLNGRAIGRYYPMGEQSKGLTHGIMFSFRESLDFSRCLILMTVQPEADQPSAETGADLRNPTPID
jgi:hypothetical protein